MGGQISAQTKIHDNHLLKKFAGLQPITDNDPFWNQLIAFNWHVDETSRSTRLAFDQQCQDLLESLMYNTTTTGNFAALVRVFLRRANELSTSALTEDRIFQWQTSNCLLLIRCCCKFFAERLTEGEYAKTFSRQIMNNDGHVVESRSDSCDVNFVNTCEELIYTLVQLIIELKPDDASLPVLIESIRTLILLLSVQLHKEQACCAKLNIVQYMMRRTVSDHAPALCRALLHNYAVGGVDKSVNSKDADQSGSLVLGIANSLWSSLAWATGDDGQQEQDELSRHPCARSDASLSNLSLLLLVALCCHSAEEDHRSTDMNDDNFDEEGNVDKNANKSVRRKSPTDELNRYRAAIATFGNEQELAAAADPSTSFVFDYSVLYSRICATVEQEAPMLLLYILLHSNVAFRNFVLSRIDLERLVVPVLRVLHQSQSDKDESEQKRQANEHHMYLALVALLMLTEDEFYCKVVHESMINNVDWYSPDRSISTISLGGLIVLVLTRTIQVNIVKVRDRYLHTNSLAALSNMSAYFKGLPALVCQKLVALLEALSRRHQRLVQSMNQGLRADGDATQQMQLLQGDITAFEEAIRTLLEIINRTLTHQLRANAHLVYTMLYKRQLFEQLHEQALFHDLGWNIAAVLNHFSARVHALGAQATVPQVLASIESGALQWPSDRLKKFPDVTFRYVEDENTDAFFVPYVWKLIYRHSTLHWQASSVKLFNAHQLIDS